MSANNGNVGPVRAGAFGSLRATLLLLALAVAGAVWLWILQERIGETTAAIRTEANGVRDLYSVSEWQAKLAAIDAERVHVRRPSGSTIGAPNQPPPARLTVYEVRTKAAVVLGPTLVREYGPLLAVLHLGSGEENRLLEILSGKTIGLCPNEPPLTNLSAPAALKAFSAEVDSEAETIVGESRYPAYRQFLRSLPARNLAADLQNGMAASGEALSTPQFEQLVSIFERDDPANNGGPTTGNYPNNCAAATGTSETLVTDAMLSEVSKVANAEQVAQLKAIQRIQVAQIALNQAEARAYEEKSPR